MDEGEVETFNRTVKRAADSHKIAYILEPKFDGFSVEVVYENGRF